ncbi:hypothetical protein D0Z07_4165 [Hyphodiscus hymeniophilus]|uniref:Transcription factor domain-containing protein n=1 Tax=Hyphodiscus hymeniophilus TaxID=353542 RepID=A0A9P6VK52_9HELO|nr:hypothetical protein D0Z07_4165 [Hyphodiscus hymeniophilus]
MEAAKNGPKVPAINARRAPKSRGGCLRCKAKRASLDGSKQNEEAHVNDQPTLSSEEAEVRTATTPSSHSSPVMTSSRRGSGTFTDSLSAIRQQLHRSTVPEFLLHLPTMLVEYYFNYVCQIFSSFDGALNPFRATVGKLWDGSAPIYYAIQSMAAAYLANHFPRMSPVGVQMQRETYRSLYQIPQGGRDNFENLDKTLLTVLLVGQTTVWHNPGDLGLVHLKSAKRLNRRRLEQQGDQIETRARRQNEFFEQCILYWDMLAGFVEDDIDEIDFEELQTPGSTSSVGEAGPSNEERAKVFPHPWTGVAPKVQRLFAQVGRLIRSYRRAATTNSTSTLDFLSLDVGFDMNFPRDPIAMTDAVLRAQLLEEKLLSFRPPLNSSLVDAGDENTPVQQYIVLAEAYRCAALLEIYRVFPSILLQRVPLNNNTFPQSSSDPNSSQNIFDFLSIPSSQSPDDFIISLAMHTISLLGKLPPSSGTRCLQPIVVIVAGSELKFASASTSDPLSAFASTASSSIFNSITNREVDIASARQFVVTRLQEFQLSLPAKPIVKALQLIQETWARADLGQEVFWMDVMEEMGWQSIFG